MSSGGPVEVGFFKYAAELLLSAVMILVGALWGKHNREIQEVKAELLTKASTAEMDRRSSARDAQFSAFRADIKELFDRDDDLKDHLTAKIDTLRADIHDDLNRVIDEVRKAR